MSVLLLDLKNRFSLELFLTSENIFSRDSFEVFLKSIETGNLSLKGEFK